MIVYLFIFPVEMASSVINWELEKYIVALNRETAHALEAMHIPLRNLGPKQLEFKIHFLKIANYQ